MKFVVIAKTDEIPIGKMNELQSAIKTTDLPAFRVHVKGNDISVYV